MCWFSHYLLVGFVLNFVATGIFRFQTTNGWRWELFATLAWPLTGALSIADFLLKRRVAAKMRGSRDTVQ